MNSDICHVNKRANLSDWLFNQAQCPQKIVRDNKIRQKMYGQLGDKIFADEVTKTTLKWLKTHFDKQAFETVNVLYRTFLIANTQTTGTRDANGQIARINSNF